MSEKFTFLCPFCESEIRVPISAAGKSGTCKKCRNKVIVPSRTPPAPVPPRSPAMDPRPFELEKRQSAAVPIGLALLCAGVSGWAWFARDEFYPLDYASILVASTGLFMLLNLVMRISFSLIFACAAFVGGFVLYAANDLVTENWSKDQIDYTDRVVRFGRNIRRRSMVIHDETGEEVSRLSGEMSESGKPHGKWHITSFPSYQSREQWFWYGDKITEGEWHTRSSD